MEVEVVSEGKEQNAETQSIGNSIAWSVGD